MKGSLRYWVFFKKDGYFPRQQHNNHQSCCLNKLKNEIQGTHRVSFRDISYRSIDESLKERDGPELLCSRRVLRKWGTISLVL